jgi:antitoxin MazE
MKVAIVRIGNSRGVRLPKAVLDQVGFGTEAELTVEAGQVVIAPIHQVRAGWSEAFAADATGLSVEDCDWLEAPLLNDDPE